MTEKNYNPEQKTSKTMKKQSKAGARVPVTEIKKDKKVEEVKKETKKPVQQKIVKRDKAEVNSTSVPISTLDAKFICKFIKGKTIEKAMEDLELVIRKKKAVPMIGEIPHRKGKGIMSGRFPGKASGEFIIILKGLRGNANVNGLEAPIITEAVANKAARPFGRFGRIKRKRTHLKIVVTEKKVNKGAKK
ncbi:hypothetical protein HN832_02205 [archaeon]|jgi:ribosomal protein L22|nr:hypothetical protein [archaeon]MBT4373167.1 hypothetical protein [archaeon]MBT4531512.1 hypothetical protein [archaeon]MBT7001310.1 hypothetical protein [archaeon]MBT7282204.1 hypothetical protein [archaeon]